MVMVMMETKLEHQVLQLGKEERENKNKVDQDKGIKTP